MPIFQLPNRDNLGQLPRLEAEKEPLTGQSVLPSHNSSRQEDGIDEWRIIRDYKLLTKLRVPAGMKEDDHANYPSVESSSRE